MPPLWELWNHFTGVVFYLFLSGLHTILIISVFRGKWNESPRDNIYQVNSDSIGPQKLWSIWQTWTTSGNWISLCFLTRSIKVWKSSDLQWGGRTGDRKVIQADLKYRPQSGTWECWRQMKILSTFPLDFPKVVCVSGKDSQTVILELDFDQWFGAGQPCWFSRAISWNLPHHPLDVSKCLGALRFIQDFTNPSPKPSLGDRDTGSWI